MKEERRGEKVDAPVRRISWTTIPLGLGLILLVIIVGYIARGGNSDQDKLTNAEVATSMPPASHDKLCASSATFDLIKRELFRLAAERRGSDQATFERLSGVAVVRMENPVMESEDASTGAVNCSSSLSLDLPPGVVAAGGRRTLMADVDYMVTAAAAGGNPVVQLRNADAIIAPLASLVQVSQPAQQAPDSMANNEAATQTASSTLQSVEAAPQAPLTAPASVPPANARSGFDCSAARSPGEIAVCNDPGLAALDRQMTAQYSRAFALASPDQRAILRDTARRFDDFRDHCSTIACVSEAYAGRMREIRDIINDRWQSPR